MLIGVNSTSGTTTPSLSSNWSPFGTPCSFSSPIDLVAMVWRSTEMRFKYFSPFNLGHSCRSTWYDDSHSIVLIWEADLGDPHKWEWPWAVRSAGHAVGQCGFLVEPIWVCPSRGLLRLAELLIGHPRGLFLLFLRINPSFLNFFLNGSSLISNLTLF